ncbi:MAG: carbohydrate binding family 9 domain-containing protein [Bacteroidales bacterium]|nr:carbohydrate binding family 9 domain-containing protein [Bacteroidales bacterium]
MRKIIFILLIFCTTAVFAQESLAPLNKTTSATRITTPPKIDGILNEAIWNRPPTFTGLTEYLPTFGVVETEDEVTRVWVFYDDTGIYIGAEMTDKSRRIKREFTRRDDTGNSDWFSVYIDTYKDGLNGYEFGVTSAGVQFDRRYSPISGGSGRGGGWSSGGDGSWDAVWSSAVHVEADRWTVEMKIPYSAIRFPDRPEQQWGFNVQRYRRETRQELFWSPRRPDIENFISQWGTLGGITNVTAPLLLSLSPYIAAAADHHTQGGWQRGFNVGADAKWGINQAFTLDAALIPDFGQVQSDPRVHNLTPFEVQYNEKRPFFMEGTELFNKGSYFYSRRIGGQPMYYNRVPLESDEVIKENPSESRLLNTIKFSGRTTGGLGIGILNAITSNMYAVIQDTLTGHTRRYRTAPVVNSNVLVLDQSLKNNSYLSAVNASVIRADGAYNSNVTGLLFRFNDQNRRYYLQGQGTTSLFSHKDAGFSYTLRAGKARGAWQYYAENAFLDNKIDINDLGMQRERNLMRFTGNLSHNNYTPSSWYARYNFGITPTYTRRFLPGTYEKASVSANSMLLLRDYTMFRISGTYAFRSKDFYEPKKEGRLFNKPEGIGGSFFLSSNYNKPVFVDLTLGYETLLQHGENAYELQVKPGFRISQKVTLVLSSKLNNLFNNRGYYSRNSAPVGSAQDTVIFASRNRSIMENVVDGRFTFNNKMNITLAARHYVSKVKNKEFFFLNHDGDLEASLFKGREGEVYNLFYVDFLYTWRFAPGSELNLIWKNEINPQGVDTLHDSYFRDISSLSDAPQRNLLTLKLIYYLDWMTIFGKKSTNRATL